MPMEMLKMTKEKLLVLKRALGKNGTKKVRKHNVCTKLTSLRKLNL